MVEQWTPMAEATMKGIFDRLMVRLSLVPATSHVKYLRWPAYHLQGDT
jgi:hypothetical protein